MKLLRLLEIKKKN